VHYTVGQRRRLGIGGLTEPLYVVRIKPSTRQIVVGPKSELACRDIYLRGVNWLGDQPFQSSKSWTANVRIRSTRPPARAEIFPFGNGTAKVRLFEPEEAVAPGQACVFYEVNGSRVLGGGWIERKDRIELAGSQGGLNSEPFPTGDASRK